MRTLALCLIAVSLASCGHSAEEFAGAYEGQETQLANFGGLSDNKTTPTTRTVTAVDGATLRYDHDQCPVEYTKDPGSDLHYSLKPRTCSMTLGGLPAAVSLNRGGIDASQPDKLEITFGGVVTVVSTVGKIDVSFSGSRLSR